jgi:hypothetical protein
MSRHPYRIGGNDYFDSRVRFIVPPLPGDAISVPPFSALVRLGALKQPTDSPRNFFENGVIVDPGSHPVCHHAIWFSNPLEFDSPLQVSKFRYATSCPRLKNAGYGTRSVTPPRNPVLGSGGQLRAPVESTDDR